MSTEDPGRRHARSKSLFEAALALPPDQRDAFLLDACKEDRALLEELRGMLAVESGDADFLQPMPLTGAVTVLDEGTPEHFGPFRVLRLIGQGGMGAVYEAEQERPRRSVALKVLHPGLGTTQILRRFELETEVLGRLEHPSIARIYEAGSKDTGHGLQPWIAMELIHGLPLTDYCRQKELSLEDRLELIARVADAVQHAHQRGIVHRDLKPGNVLVEAGGQPKVLDFGIAKPTDGDLAAATLQTDPGMIIGTLQYMSPEQASGDPDAIDVRTDVYSLGVMLYEIAADRPPLDLRGLPMHEALRRVLQDEPPGLRTLGAKIPMDVAVIAQTALAKQKERRYPSAAELSADLRRFLRREPITALAPSTWYRIQRFSARNKPLVAGAAATLAALVLGLLTTIWQRDQAREALARAEGINKFLVRDLIASPSPERLGREVRVADVLAPAVLSAERAFRDQPRVAAEVLDAIGASYRALGLSSEAEPVSRRALELLRDETDDLSLRAQGTLLRILTDLDRGEEAVAVGADVVEASATVLGPDHPQTLDRRVDYANARWAAGDVDWTLEELEAVASEQSRVLGPRHPDTLATRSQLAINLAGAGRIGKAQELLQQTLDDQADVLGPLHPGTLATRGHLGWVLNLGSEWSRASQLYAELIPSLEQVYGPGHVYPALATVHRAHCLLQLRRGKEAEDLVRSAIEVLQTRLGGGHTSTLDAQLILSKSLYRQERYQEAIQTAEAVVSRRRTDSSPDENLGHALSGLGLCYQQAGTLDAAAAAYREAADVFRKAYGADSDFVGQMLYNLGVVSKDAGDYDAAAEAFLEALRIDAHNWGPDHQHVISGRFNLARALLPADRPEEAFAQIEQALTSARVQDLAPTRILVYRSVLGRAMLRTGREGEGEQTLVEVIEGLAGSSEDEVYGESCRALADHLERQGRTDEAAAYRKRLR